MTRAIKMYSKVGVFAENKDVAQQIRVHELIPLLEKGDEIVIDFENVESATQSFMHALISDLIRRYGVDVLDRIIFKNCNDTIKKIITIVTEYMQQED